MKNYASKGKRIGLLLAMLFITSWMFAQVTVTGNVRDERETKGPSVPQSYLSVVRKEPLQTPKVISS